MLVIKNNFLFLNPNFLGGFMNTQKHLIITGISNISWKDATLKAINEVSKTIDYISSIKILEQRASIVNNQITEYFVDIDLCFMIDENRK